MNLLHIDSSILGENSASRQLTAEIVASKRAQHPDLEVVYRDLAANPLDHLGGMHIAAAQGFSPEPNTIEADLMQGMQALEEFLAADIVVVGAPMYNFAIPSQLKAWVDRIAVVGRTFRYTETGPEGLAGGKTVLIASTRGGFYGEGAPGAFLDHQETYLTGIFGFVGITDVRFVRAEGLNIGPEQRAAAMAQASGGLAALIN